MDHFPNTLVPDNSEHGSSEPGRRDLRATAFRWPAALLGACVLFAACGDDDARDVGSPDAALEDGGAQDADLNDSGPLDTGADVLSDAGDDAAMDAGPADVGTDAGYDTGIGGYCMQDIGGTYLMTEGVGMCASSNGTAATFTRINAVTVELSIGGEAPMPCNLSEDCICETDPSGVTMDFNTNILSVSGFGVSCNWLLTP